MAVERVIAVFKAAKSDVALKNKIQNSLSKESFIEMASGEGYQFNEDELNLILKIAKQTSLNPCSIEQVFDDSSDYLESEEDDTNDSAKIISIAKSRDDTMSGGMLQAVISADSAKIISIAKSRDDTASAPGNIWDSVISAGSSRIRRLTLSINIDVSELDLSSWNDDLALIKSILEK